MQVYNLNGVCTTNIKKDGNVYYLGFFFEVLCEVINANTVVATQWPLKHAQ